MLVVLLGAMGFECLNAMITFDCSDQEYTTDMKTGLSTGACKVARFDCRQASCCNLFSAIDIHKIISPAFMGKRSEWLQQTLKSWRNLFKSYDMHDETLKLSAPQSAAATTTTETTIATPTPDNNKKGSSCILAGSRRNQLLVT